MKQSQKIHLPVMGVGPVYVVSIVIVTIIAILFGRTTGNIADQSASQSFTLRDVFSPHTPLSIFFTTLGVLIILLGLIIYILAIKIKITKAIKENRLLTTGVYSIVRNPIYSAWLLLCTGALLCSGSLLLTLLFFLIFWLYLTILMKHTEEKWLTKLFKNNVEQMKSRPPHRAP